MHNKTKSNKMSYACVLRKNVTIERMEMYLADGEVLS